MPRIAAALLVAVACAACGSSQAAPRPLHVDDAGLGLDCGDASPCPHLGIALWLAEQQRRVTVTINGRRVTLVSHRRYEFRRYWQGFVDDPTAERVAGDLSRTVQLAVEATGRDGIVRRATLERPVSSGWG